MLLRQLVPAVCLALGLPLTAAAQDTAAGPAAARVDSVFSAYDRTSGPGCALGVYRNGAMAYARGYGMADLNQGIAIGPSTVFYIASTSKQFAAMSIALLAERGTLSLDDPIRKYVPELPAYADAITIRHLVHHTSGLRDYLGLWSMGGRSFADEIPTAVALDLIARQRGLNFAPGTEWSYSNSGYFLLSVIVERASGKSLRDFAEEHMFGPLGMRRTHFHDDNSLIVPRRAEGYQPNGRGGFNIVRTSFALVGDGGLLTTVEDLLRWDANFYDNRLGRGGPALIDLVTTPGRLDSGKDLTYGFGLMPGTRRGLATVRHGGAFIGFRAELVRYPTERFAVAVLCNDYSADPSALADRVADVYLAARLAPVTTAKAPEPGVTVSPSVLQRLAGRYEVVPGVVLEVQRTGETLSARGFGPPADLRARSDSSWSTAAGLELEFRTLPGGETGLLLPAVGGAEVAPSLPPVPTYSADALQAFAGRFASDELDSWYTVEAKDGALRFRSRLGPWVPLRPIRPDAFLIPGSRLTFERDGRRRVTGFQLDAGRVRGVVARLAGVAERGA